MSKHDGKMGCKPYATTRRQLLKAGGVLIPAAAMAPGLFLRTAGAQAASSSFDYYISPTGSDSNPGTLTQPWAITAINTKQSTYAGKRLGLLPGTYDVSRLMRLPVGGNPQTALIVNGSSDSSSPTYIASSDAVGNYSPRTATLDAKGSSGYYGGGNSIAGSVIGGGLTYGTNPAANKHNWIIDGLVVTGFSTWGIIIGNYDGSDGPIQNAVIKNCELAHGNASQCTVADGINLAPLINYSSTNALVTNNYIHDNIGPGASGDSQHFSAVYVWGLGGGTSGFTFTYNTVVASGNVHQKEATIYDSEVAYNYIDMTGSQPLAGSGQNGGCLSGWGPDKGKGTLTRIHHNILISPNMQYLWLTNDTGQLGWDTPGQIFNNTCIATGNQSAGGAAGFVFFEMTPGSRVCTFYNNLFCDNGYTVATDYGYVLVNSDVFKLADYNIYGGQNHYTTMPAGVQSGGEVGYSSLASYQAAVNAEAHSQTVASSALFTSAGVLSLKFKVQAPSIAYQAGRVGGVSSGAVCNVGAWDGSVSRIGCDFAQGLVLPDAPLLNTVS